MIGLLCFVLAVMVSPFKSKARLEAENATLRLQLIVLRRKLAWPRPAHEQRSLVLRPAVSLVSINPNGSHDYPSRDPRALASGGLSLLLAGEVTIIGRTAADRDGPARADPANELRSFSGGQIRPRKWHDKGPLVALIPSSSTVNGLFAMKSSETVPRVVVGFLKRGFFGVTPY
jgi:hypothetical protein